MPFSLFPDKNNIAKLVGDIEEIVSTDCVSYCIIQSKWTCISKAAVHKCFIN